MRWPWRRRGAIGPRPMVSRAMELETAKEILAEVFHARRGRGDDSEAACGDELAEREEKLAGGVRGKTMASYFLCG
ncbi:MAG: hypothetical protein QG575_914 [Euryarchaeota archaeon]|nr:hypothetical protein [Euryarchaeota archaeon]